MFLLFIQFNKKDIFLGIVLSFDKYWISRELDIQQKDRKMNTRKKALPFPVSQTKRLHKLKQSLDNWKQLNDHDLAFTLMPNTDLPRTIADKIFTKFWHLADQKTCGNRRRRFNVGLERMVTTEQGVPLNSDGMNDWSRFHQHGTMKLPSHMKLWQLKAILQLCCSKCECLDSIQVVEISKQYGWSRYTNKQTNEGLDNFNPFDTHLNISTP